MKIAMLAAASDIHAIRWANKFAELGNKVYLICQQDHDVKQDIPNENVEIHKLRFKGKIGYYLNAMELKKLFESIRPDILNVHYASGYGTLARLTKFHPCVISVYGSDVYDFPKKSKINLSIIRKNLNYADAIASTSFAMAKQTVSLKINHELSDIKITPFGVDTKKFFNKKLDKKDKPLILGSIKKLAPKYGIFDGIRAIEYIIKNNLIDINKNPIEYHIYGEGEQRNEFERYIKNNKLSDAVFLKSRIPNEKVPEALNNFDIFIGTSVLNSESFGVAIVEAMSCEVPVIVSDVDGFSEVTSKGKYGAIFSKGDYIDLAEKIISYIENPTKRELMGINGREKVLLDYNWDDNANTLYSFLQGVKKDSIL
ncbi:glycosyltransferase [Exiguobacterium sp. RIT341]|uniref:glycosyltransferase n=1 Tax=Exiguobacterium sp. RIT341 TaxID=1470592 RepID=UPI000445F47D|nr:glycosyltransferase [Exiguobacterium sp. RIT341]EZP59694.1 Glycosyl transferase group 1 precursor [Exiguobacterium sp. RIT341]